MDKMTRIVNQLSSGRWLLTQAAALCMIMFTVTDCYIAMKHPDQKLPVSIDGMVAIITMVFMAYFQKQDAAPTEGA